MRDVLRESPVETKFLHFPTLFIPYLGYWGFSRGHWGFSLGILGLFPGDLLFLHKKWLKISKLSRGYLLRPLLLLQLQLLLPLFPSCCCCCCCCCSCSCWTKMTMKFVFFSDGNDDNDIDNGDKYADSGDDVLDLGQIFLLFGHFEPPFEPPWP